MFIYCGLFNVRIKWFTERKCDTIYLRKKGKESFEIFPISINHSNAYNPFYRLLRRFTILSKFFILDFSLNEGALLALKAMWWFFFVRPITLYLGRKFQLLQFSRSEIDNIIYWYTDITDDRRNFPVIFLKNTKNDQRNNDLFP